MIKIKIELFKEKSKTSICVKFDDDMLDGIDLMLVHIKDALLAIKRFKDKK